MISVSLPDGSRRELEDQASSADLASSISKGLAKNAVAAKVNGTIVDLASPLPDGATVAILTKKDEEALEVLRHSAAHLMADAILRVFPKAQLTIGPVVENGFYYDIFHARRKDHPRRLSRRSKSEMQKIAKKAHPFARIETPEPEKDENFLRYKQIDGGQNKFKLEIVDDVLGRGDVLSFYKHGDFIDLCRGPHVPNTGFLKNVKLTHGRGFLLARRCQPGAAGARLRDRLLLEGRSERSPSHAGGSQKRDHRVLGEQLDLFSFNEDAPGFPFFHPRGATMFNTLQEYMRGLLRRRGYKEVKTPLILSEHLWHRSGHYDNYLENMFFTKLKLRDEKKADVIHDNVDEDRPTAVKPMNCPGHVLIYAERPHSHNEFPLRIAEMGLVHRRELSGTRHGLFRVQAFTQDDAHHFCTPDQIEAEIGMLIDFFSEVYGAFDLTDVRIELSTRPEKSIGSDEMWEKAETALQSALDAKGIPYQVNPGDGAFYGPKIDFHIRDVLKRSWQCGTIQLDFSMPARFDLKYIGADGDRHTPVMIHRACYGSLERFMGIIIENYAGRFPLWLAPDQVIVLPVSDKYFEYAKQVQEKLRDAGLRVDVNLKDDRIGYKIRQASLQKYPYMLVVGETEQKNDSVNVRSRDQGELGEMSIEGLLEHVAAERLPGGKPKVIESAEATPAPA